MKTLTIKELDPIRIPLLKKLYKSHYPSTKIKGGEYILVAEVDTKITGVVRFRTIDKWQLLTGMMVIPEARHQGIASQLLTYSQKHRLDNNVYCFAYQHLQPLYEAHGFQHIAVDTLPATLNKLYTRYIQSGKPLIAMQYRA
ncbi:acyltransferase [Vibrio sp. UCD-FRSSP16_10]|uniref:GNAT family N-acetyltransferase n=1 Tax=unclassified Vibrio TaxID=2614977 RepID=UPI0008018E73|nr:MULTISPECIES: GNAT family N-acetyltransferase [unclassified Vibrio]OBT12027.1 acyltransferase [Vibrio sp. UCD-FRSSP16_30]OBT18179.1 acyltransferase [Vibrio sp. UCD-FRSSP16_10]